MLARIYRPSRNVMQSGKARTKNWVLEYEPSTPLEVEPLMGWTATGDMARQIWLDFDTLEEAVAYAQRNEIPFQVFEPHDTTARPKSYSDNFRYDRKIPWSH
jgi:hypothetical protein